MNYKVDLKKLRSCYGRDPTRGIQLAKVVISEARQVHDEQSHAYGTLYLGMCYYLQSSYTLAVTHIQRSLDYFSRTNDIHGIMLAENALGGTCIVQEEYTDALHHFINVQDLALKSNDLDRLTAAYINLGIVYEKIESFDKALDYLAKGQEAVQLTGNKQHKGSIHLSLGTIYSKKGEYETALKHLRSAMSMFEKIQTVDISEVLMRLTDIYINQGNLELAEQTARRALNQSRKNRLHLLEIECIYFLAKIYTLRGQEEDAIAYYQESLHLAEAYGSRSFTIKNSRAIMHLYHKGGDDSKAFSYGLKLLEYESKQSDKQLRRHITNIENLQTLQKMKSECDMLKRRSKDLEVGYKTIHTLGQIGHEIISIIDFDLALDTIQRRIRSLTQVDAFGIYTYEESSDELFLRYAIVDGKILPQQNFPIDTPTSLSILCAKERREIYINEGIAEINALFPGFSTDRAFKGNNSLIYIPLEARSEVVGVITIQAKKPNQYTPSDRDIMNTIGSFVAVSIANQRILTKLKQANNDLILKQEFLELTLKELQIANKKIERLATYDTLTGLPNRYLLYKRLEEILHLSKRNNRQFGLFFIDIDNFKQLNDTYGHQAGDSALRIVSNRVSMILRKSDLIARVGGDEFIAVFYDIKAIEDLTIIAEKILHTMLEPIEFATGNFVLGASIGISIYPQDGTTKEVLIEHADKALYNAKRMGKGLYRYHSHPPDSNPAKTAE